MIELYEFQKGVKGQLYDAIREGHKKICVVSSTGSGKSVILSSVVKDAISKGRKALVLTHLSVLIGQLSKELSSQGVDHSFIKAGRKFEEGKDAYVVSLESLERRGLEVSFDVLVVDEAHSASFRKSYQKLIDSLYDPYVIGFTASPWRTSKKETLADKFDKFVYAPTQSWLIEHGYLVPGVYYGFDLRADLSSVKTTAGDYQNDQLAIACNTPALVAHAVDQYRKICPSRKGIVFAVNIAHSKALTEAFQNAGFSAAHIDGTMKESEREIYYNQLERGEIQILCSCNALTTGFNVKSIDAGLMCRPTKSRNLWLQTIGRCMRICDGKENFIWLDQAGNNLRFGFPEELTIEHFQPEKPGTYVAGETPVKECPKCHAQNLISAKECKVCGEAFLIRAVDKLEITEDFVLRSTDDVAKKINFFKRMARSAYHNRKHFSMAVVTFKDRFGEWPKKEIKVNAVFSGIATEANQLNFADYLIENAKKKDKGKKWVLMHLNGEFDKATLDSVVSYVKNKFLDEEIEF